MILEIATLSSSSIHVDAQGGVTIPNKTFKADYRLCRAEGSGTTFKQMYLEERWEWFNEHSFGGTLRRPTLAINRSQKTLGVWYINRRLLELGKRMFLLTHDRETLATLLHEMCHQYTDEVLKAHLDGIDTGGQGPVWQSVMVSVGLPPDRKYMGDADTITPVKQLEQREEKKELLQRHENLTTHVAKFTVMRYINPSKNVDCPAMIHPRTHATDNRHVASLFRKDGHYMDPIYVAPEHVVVPGPLKIKTPLYRKAQEVADEYNRRTIPQYFGGLENR